MKARIRLGTIMTTAVIDTGASQSVISAEYLDIVEQQGFIQDIQQSVALANGGYVPIRAEFHCEIRLGQRSVGMRFLVLPHAIDRLILGLDFLGKMRATISCGEQIINLQEFRSSVYASTQQVVTLRSTETVKRKPEKQPESQAQASKTMRIAEIVEPPSDDAATAQSDDYVLPPEAQQMLTEELKLFDQVSGPTHLSCHKIFMKDTVPIKQRYYHRNPALQEIINKEVDELLEQGCIEPSKSP